MRVFAGPNGSGKSTIFREIDKQFDTGVYLNADEIEKDLLKDQSFDLSKVGLKTVSKRTFNQFVYTHSLIGKANKEGFELSLSLEQGRILSNSNTSHSYEASLVADFIRFQLLKAGRKFTFETVMSHPSKIDVLDYAKKEGFKTYLYYVCTKSPEINVERVAQRVQQGGHPVPEKRIRNRYSKSLSLLLRAIRKTYRTYLWDNSGNNPELILDAFNGETVTFHANSIPFWVDKYVLNG